MSHENLKEVEIITQRNKIKENPELKDDIEDKPLPSATNNPPPNNEMK